MAGVFAPSENGRAFVEGDEANLETYDFFGSTLNFGRVED